MPSSSLSGPPAAVLPPNTAPAPASGDFRAQFQQSCDAEEPAADAAATRTVVPSSTKTGPGKADLTLKDARLRKAASLRINLNLSAVAPAIAPAAPAASLPLRLQLVPDATPDEGSAGNRPVPLTAGGQADAISQEDPALVMAEPAGELAFALKIKPDVEETPATPASPSTPSTPETQAARTNPPSSSAKPASLTPSTPISARVAPAAASMEKEASDREQPQQENTTGGKSSGLAPEAAAAVKATSSTSGPGFESSLTATAEVRTAAFQTTRQDPPKTEAPAPTHATATVETDPKPVSHAPQEISLHVASDNGDDRRVEIRLTERAGEVRVAVRTPDESLARSMREDLGSLTGKLTQGGFATEAWAPSHSASSSFSDHHETANPDTNGGQKHQSQQQNNSGEQQQEQEDGSKRPSWMEELDHSLNRSNVWQAR